MTERSTVLLVLGMHRSGTSALTRVLNLCGVELGDRLLPPADDNNRHGFWEHADAVDIDERLLHHLGRSWWDARELPAGWLDTPAAAISRERIAALARDEFSRSPLWAVKDPRLCRLLSLWTPALLGAGVDVKLVYMQRHPDEVIASLARRDGLSEAESGVLLMHHFFDAAAGSGELPRCVVTYEALMDDWRRCVERISRELDVSLPRIGDAAEEIGAFLSPGARHHHAPPDAAVLAETLNGRVYRLARDSVDSAAFWAGLAPLLDTWHAYRRDVSPYVNELLDMLATRGAIEGRLAATASAGRADGFTMSPLGRLQFRMLTGLQDGVGRLGQAAADVAAMVRTGTESAVGISGEIAATVATMKQDLGEVSASLAQTAALQRDQASLQQDQAQRLAGDIDRLRTEASELFARREREYERDVGELRQQLLAADATATARHDLLTQQVAALAERLDAMRQRENQRDERRLARRLRRLFGEK